MTDDARPTFTCPLCGAVSAHPDDIANRYCGRCHVFVDDVRDAARDTAALHIFTVYDHPRDYPSGYMVRQWAAIPGRGLETLRAWRLPSLEAARAVIPMGLARFDRHPTDDPVIVESWL